MEWFLGLLDFFGITRESVTPIALVMGAGFFFLWKYWLREIKYNLGILRNAIAEIQRFLKGRYKDDYYCLHPIGTNKFIGHNSPLTILGAGSRLLEKSGAKEFIDSNFETIRGNIDLRNPDGPFDLQEIAKDIVVDLKNSDFMQSIKDFVYNNPHFEGEPLEVSDILQVMALYVRDKYINNHRELEEK